MVAKRHKITNVPLFLKQRDINSYSHSPCCESGSGSGSALTLDRGSRTGSVLGMRIWIPIQEQGNSQKFTNKTNFWPFLKKLQYLPYIKQVPYGTVCFMNYNSVHYNRSQVVKSQRDLFSFVENQRNVIVMHLEKNGFEINQFLPKHGTRTRRLPFPRKSTL